MTPNTIRYGSWSIAYNPPPIPVRVCDFQFWHDDYDGAPDAKDDRCGTAETLDEAMWEIDMIEELQTWFLEQPDCARCDGEGTINVEDRPYPNDVCPSTHTEPCPECAA